MEVNKLTGAIVKEAACKLKPGKVMHRADIPVTPYFMDQTLSLTV